LTMTGGMCFRRSTSDFLFVQSGGHLGAPSVFRVKRARLCLPLPQRQIRSGTSAKKSVLFARIVIGHP
jgi:hypothetical protein